MNIIEEKFSYATNFVKKLKEVSKTAKRPVSLIVETYHIILPQNDKGIEMVGLIEKFNQLLQAKGAIVLRVFGRDIGIEEMENLIATSITLSKKNIQDMITKYKLTGENKPKNDLAGSQLMNNLKSDSLPQ